MAFKYTVSKEYKPRSDFRVKQVKCNRRLYGEIREYPKRKTAEGKVIRVYWATRLPGEFVVKHMAWAFDKLMFDKFQTEGVPLTHIGVIVTSDTKRRSHIEDKIEEKWLITKDDFFKHVMREEDGKLVQWNYTAKGGSNQYLVPLACFNQLILAPEASIDHKIKEMEIRK